MQSRPRAIAGGTEKAPRSAYTIVELLVSTISATLLMTGLASSLYLAIRSFDGSSNASATTLAADVHDEILVDLKHAKGFLERSSDAVTFTVPDRDGDLQDETITYAWTGLPTAKLNYAINGNAPVTLLEDVQDFELTYLSRFVLGDAPEPPPLDPSQWGMRWRESETFGYDTQLPFYGSSSGQQIGTRATLSEAGTVTELSVYLSFPFGGSTDFTLALYDVDANNDPQNLLVKTALGSASSSGWHSLPISPTALTPGEYYLAVSYGSSACYHRYDLFLGESHISNINVSQTNNWPASWISHSTSSARLSIYATYDPN